jgi:hypothetical protein
VGLGVYRLTTLGGAAMGRRLCVLVMTAAAMLLCAGVAEAAQHTTVTQTNHIHGVFAEPNFGANPCTGAATTGFNAFGNVIEHETFFIEDGQVTEVWATFTETGKVSVTDANGVSFTGHFTVWGNFNLNEKNTNSTFTLTVNLAGSDGSTIVAHEVQHFALNANGTVTVNFDRIRLTCG